MAPIIPIVAAGLGASAVGASSAVIAGTVAAGAAGAFLAGGGDGPPPVINQASNPIANQFKPINFTSVFDELSKDKLDIIKGLDGKLNLKFSNNDSRIDLNSPVQSRGVNTKLPAIHPINERAAGVVALSQAMTRLGNTVEQMENTNPYLIEQNQELINSFRQASEKALDRGFDFRQHAISQKLSKMGLAESSTAFGTQVALAREKANAYADLELKQAELAQGLKQQSLANLHQRGDLLGKNAQVELGKFNSESQAQLANQELIQKQAVVEKELDLKNEEQRLATEFANRNMAEQRRARMAELGSKMFTSENQHSILAQNVDNTAISQQNQAQFNQYSQTSNPFKEALASGFSSFVGNIGTKLSGNMFGSGGREDIYTSGGRMPWHEPLKPQDGTTGWSKNSTKLIGTKWS